MVFNMTISKFGNKTRSLRTQQSERKLDSLAHFLNNDVLLLTAAYSDYAGHFILGQYPNMELLLLLSLYSLLNSLYFPGW